MSRKKPEQDKIRPMVDGEPMSRDMADMVAKAWNLAATMESAHIACRRRECRDHQRCRADHGASDDRFCVMPLSREADKRALGMLTFVTRLALDPWN